jgi:hypothetical protein
MTGVWEADVKAGMQQMLEPAMFFGLGVVAVWTHVRCPRLRPSSLVWAAVHVMVAFAAFAFLPALVNFLVPLLPSRTTQPFFVLTLLIPALTYVLLSWVWLIARILQEIGGTPRGGHPASAEH